MSPLQVAELNPIKRDAHSQSLPFVTFRAPSKGALPPGSRNRASIEREALFPEPPYNCLSEFLVNGPPWGDVCPLSPSPHILLDPQKSPPNRAPTERDAPFPKSSKCLLKYPVNGLHGFPNRPLRREAPVSRIFFYTFS